MEQQSLDSENSMVLELAERLAKLPTTNIREYFRGFRVIQDELDAEQYKIEHRASKLFYCIGFILEMLNFTKKLRGIQERIYYMHEDLPVQLSHLRSFREKLLLLKQKILTAMKNYCNKQEQLWALLKQNAPDIHAHLERIAQQMKELNYLKTAHKLSLARSNIKKAINVSNFSAVYDQIQSLKQYEDVDSQLDENEMEDINRIKKEVFIETEQLVSGSLKDLLKKIHYPLEEAIDLKTHQKIIRHIATLLECIGILDNGILISHCDRSKVLMELVAPLERRFYYHFFMEQKTNNPSKPEWFFTQILNWITANIDFVNAILLHIFTDKAERNEIIDNFVSNLIILAKKKVQNIRKKVADDPELFSHLIDECVAFENELQDIAIPIRPGQVLVVLCEDIYLIKWLQLERESCIAGVENVLCGDDCWNNRYQTFSDIDMQQVPECTDQFLMMIESITERYRWIESLDVQSQFLNVQIFMFDDFRLRLIHISQQVASPWEKPFIQILNSAWHIAYVLNEWNEVDIFIRIQALGKKTHFRGIFEDVSNMYRHLWRQRAEDLTSAFYQHLRVSLSRYEREHWYSWESGKPLDLTPSFCPFLLEVRRLFGHVNNAISPHSASKLYEMLNEKVAEVLLKMVTTVSLNGYGAAQILYDITNSLVPVLNSLYSHHSNVVSIETLDEPKFVEVISCLKILSQSTGTAILLYEELKQTTDDMTPSLLEPFDATIVERERAMELLKHRSDLQLASEEAVKF
uniref:RAD50-interacting protein 1 n=1 Tax=Setaria digitata TaxID=48799 RepID=A0A915PGR0_9BILA